MTEYIIDLAAHNASAAMALCDGVHQEIVRCRDCQNAGHYHPLDWRTGKPHETLEVWYCTWHSNAEGASEIEPDGFCAWGERKDA